MTSHPRTIQTTRLRLVAALVAVLLASIALPAAAEDPSTPEEEDVPHILMYSGTGGFRHGSIEHSVEVITALAVETGAFTVFHTEDVVDFTAERLAESDIVLFANTTGETPFTDEQKTMFEQWVRDGGGFMGIHAAADTNYEWDFYQTMVGAAFDSHPHTGNTVFVAPVDELDEATVQVENADHPINADVEGDSFPLREEYYKWQVNPRGTQDVRVLLSLDETDTYGFGNPPSMGPLSSSYDDDQPVEWVKTADGHGTGRVWYSNLGHYDETYDRADWQARFVNAVAWVHEGVHFPPGPDTPGPTTPTVEEVVTAPPGSLVFAPSINVIPQGQGLLLANLDTVQHNIQSRKQDANRKPLFRSVFANINGGTASVVGVADLEPGDYEYYCTIHSGMVGTVTIV
ncbi:ThuA domain-containing protein [Euzebya rosea]|uniref:ThuA domain-containing protein n=1 Tax=Euzebya rosea TaxID=2052804 RepID=UPI001474E7B5|nr:ThuA domain-containing protein [Euzebya rosea]